jgi:3-carboxy-cis,cis-muconate cycloisomerase
MGVRLLDSLATTAPLAEAFSDAAVLSAMLRFEVALASVEARAGVIPASAAEAIARAAAGGGFDPATIAHDSRLSGTIAMPFVDVLIAGVRQLDPQAATFVHWGTTSQDVTDTALVLCLLQARAIIHDDHARLSSALRRLSDAHATTVMLARTLLQPAPPVTFGLKAAGWFAAVSRSGARLLDAFDESCVLQFGGGSGTLAALGDDGPHVAADLARELGLPLPAAPWHAHRDRLAALAAACGIYAGTLGKIARDVSLLMQVEVGEAAEPGGSSSSMPHKRNPAACACALAAAARLPGLVAAFLAGMTQEHERGLGGWHAEGVTLSAAVQATGSALAAMADAIEHLHVDADRMRANIDATGGLVFAERAMTLLAPALGREAATRLVSAAIKRSRDERRPLTEVLGADADVRRILAPADLANLDSPESYLGSAEHFRRRLIE